MNITDQDIQNFNTSVKALSNYNFEEYSVKSFRRRLDKITSDQNLTVDEIISKMSVDREYLEEIIKEITVNTTELFRDPKIWRIIKNELLPGMQNRETINVWHLGASTGQEVYSMLILLNEAGLFERSTVYATDLNEDVLQLAAKGKYRYKIIADYLNNFNEVLNPEDERDKNTFVPYNKYFDLDRIKGTIKMRNFLKQKPIYRKHDLVTERNVFEQNFDIIICRNLLIYFNPNLQNRIFDFFYRILKENGVLILGAHESILGAVLAKYDKRGMLYLKR